MTPLEMYVKLYNGRLPTEFDPRYLELVKMSKYRILAVPDIGPAAKCANCGSCRQDGRGYVDFGLQVDWHGVVFLCTLCLEDISTQAGLYKSRDTQIAELKAEIEKNAFTISEGQRLEESFAHIFEEVKTYYDGLHLSQYHSSPDPVVSVEPDEEKSDGESASRTDEKSAGANLKSTKQASSTGSEKLPSLTELLNIKE